MLTRENWHRSPRRLLCLPHNFEGRNLKEVLIHTTNQFERTYVRGFDAAEADGVKPIVRRKLLLQASDGRSKASERIQRRAETKSEQLEPTYTLR